MPANSDHDAAGVHKRREELVTQQPSGEAKRGTPCPFTSCENLRYWSRVDTHRPLQSPLAAAAERGTPRPVDAEASGRSFIYRKAIESALT